ncbi:hypothetical protein CI102_5889 [Trichoderma harzianum]|nr:hypothetical protein CI102_5889 [Trichoderma harzianum]
MASREDYLVGWVCALPVEVAAAKATLDHIHDNLPSSPDHNLDNSNNYILGSLQGHNVVIAYPSSGVYGQVSVASVATQLLASFKSLRFILMVGIAGGVPETREDIRLGDVVVSKSTADWPGVIQCQYDVNGEQVDDQNQLVRGGASNQPTPLLLTAMGKAETAAIFDESHMSKYISEIVQKDPIAFAHPGPGQDVLFEPDYHHTAIESEEDGCEHCNPDRIRPRQPRETQDPIVHYGLIVSGNSLIRHGETRDQLAQKQGALCLETEVNGLKDAAKYLVIRGICDYADSHSSKLWHAYAAVAAAAYAKEVLSFIPTVVKATTLATNTYAEAAPVLDALLLTRPEVDRKSLIALKGRRVDGTCEWLIQHPSYQGWLADASQPLLWISGGPGKGKTMLSIYITEVLQPIVDVGENVLLYYFCSNRDKNRNTALTIMRGIIHQWISRHPHLAQHVRSSFEGTETTKYTVSSFVSLWRLFLTLLRQSGSSQVVCVLDGLDECEKESLGQLLDAIGTYLSTSEEKERPRLKLILLSRPQPAILERSLGQYEQIRLDASGTEISRDIETYIFAKVAELAYDQNLSEEQIAQVQRALLAGADGTFLWVGFVANELQGRSWDKMNEILHRVPKGLGGVYQRLLQQIEDKDALVPILQWVVLAARPLTLDELTAATGIKGSGNFSATDVIRNRLRLCGLMVKIQGNVVNLVHESAKEFFQSNQVNIKGISRFRMNHDTHRSLMRTCLEHVERAWAKLLIKESSRAISRKDNYGRTPLSWAVNRGHRDMVELLLDHGARINVKDRSDLTALHVAVTGQHKEIVSVLIDRGARLESKSEHGDTPLIRAIQANSREIIQILLERGARVSKLPTPPGVASLRPPTDPMEERVKELLTLQEPIFLARYNKASRNVGMVMKALGLSFRFPIILRLMTLYLKFIAFDRWEHMSVLQELVDENRTDELREWAEQYREFFVQLVVARNPRRLTAMTDLPTQIFRAVAPGDLHALLAIAVLVGSETKLAANRQGWREGDFITARAFSHWAAVAYDRDAEEYLHYGVREFLNDFDACIQSGNREDNVHRSALLLTCQFGMLDNKEPKPIDYFARVIAEFYEGYIGSGQEVDLFSDLNQACANELMVISQTKDSHRLSLFLTSIVQFAQRSQDKGLDRFLNIPSASCLILCQENAAAHRWLIGEAIPEAFSALIAQQPPGSLQKRACKTLVECLIIAKQYGLALPAAELKQRVKQHLHELPGVENMIKGIIGL